MAYKVTAPLVVARQLDGSHVHVYTDGLLPDDTDPEHIARLLDDEVIEKVGGSSKAKADPPAPADDMPKKTGKREAWHDYAIAHGKTEEELKDLSRDGIRDLFLTS